MKKGLILLAVLALCVCQSCDDSEPAPGYVSMETRTAFSQLFPSAKDIEWERNGEYIVVEFKEGGVEKEAWFDNQGNWLLTETDITYDRLPTAVREAFRNSEYASWRVEDVDWIERAGMEDLYVLDVESGELEADLYYSSDGILVKVIGFQFDSNSNTGGSDDTGGGSLGDLIPSQPTSSIEEFINTRYPDARIIEIDREDFGYTEVDIIYDGTLLEVLFDESGAWVRTTQELNRNEIPDVILNAVNNLINTTYAGYWIDDADWIDSPTGEWYQIELETSRGQDVCLRVETDGTVTVVNHF